MFSIILFTIFLAVNPKYLFFYFFMELNDIVGLVSIANVAYREYIYILNVHSLYSTGQQFNVWDL